MTVVDSEDAEAAALLGMPTRAAVGISIDRIGRKIRPHTKPAAAGLAQIDVGALLIALGGGIGLGVAGNATYDVAKAAVLSFLRRGREDPSTALSHDEAYAIALWAIARHFRQSPESVRGANAERDVKGQWTIVVASRRYEYRVVIPPGHPDVNRVAVTRRKIRRSTP